MDHVLMLKTMMVSESLEFSLKQEKFQALLYSAGVNMDSKAMNLTQESPLTFLLELVDQTMSHNTRLEQSQ